MKKIKTCTKCSLHYNQPPLLDCVKKCIDIIWIGVSAKKVSNIENSIPLASNTNTGIILNKIEKNCKTIQFYKTNLVKCVPLTGNGKIRYPTQNEILLCKSHLCYEIKHTKPKVIFLLGNIVKTNFISKDCKFYIKHKRFYSYDIYKMNSSYIIPIYHPSYISIYKRKNMVDYIKDITSLIEIFT